MRPVIRLLIFAVALIGAAPASSQTEAFLGEIKWVPYNFAPRGWAFCDGQLLPINQYQALFSLLGTTYGGDGRTTFALPDLRGRVTVHEGQGPGLSDYRLGQAGGSEQVTLNENQIPAHNHTLNASETVANAENPADNRPAAKQRTRLYSSNTESTVAMNDTTVADTGGSQGHENRPPHVVLNCIIALQGIFPSRS